MNEGLVERVEQAARELLAESPACHDWEHTLRVHRTAVKLANAEGADLAVVEVAALLHDIGRPAELQASGKICHAELGAKMVRELLPKLGVSDTVFIEHVASCVATHRYRRRQPELLPATIEAKVLFDADKIDGIGAIGLARSFHFAGRIGACVHNMAEDALSSDSYSRQDSAYREYLVKLCHVQDALLTNSGRELARERHKFMEDFFRELNLEAYGHHVAIALGANIGDALNTFDKAIGMLSKHLNNIKVADVIVTKPVDCVPGTPDFHNTVLTAFFDGSAEELLDICQGIEHALGRPSQHSSHESRTMDLDIILFDDDIISTPRLTVPHPRMHLRSFVLEPLAGIAPNWVVPGIGKTAPQLLEMLDVNGVST